MVEAAKGHRNRNHQPRRGGGRQVAGRQSGSGCPVCGGRVIDGVIDRLIRVRAVVTDSMPEPAYGSGADAAGSGTKTIQISTRRCSSCVWMIETRDEMASDSACPHGHRQSMAVSLGMPGKLESEEESAAIKEVARAARDANKVFGMHAGSAFLKEWMDEDLRFVMNSMDILLLKNALGELAEDNRAMIEGQEAKD